jgi:hypothetical protein
MWEPRPVRARFDRAARAAARRICRAGADFNFSRRQPRPCGSPHAVRPRIRNRWRDRHKCARVYLFCGGLRIRVRVSVMRTRARHMDCSPAAFVAVAFTAAITISPASAQAADVQARIDSLGVAPQRLTRGAERRGWTALHRPDGEVVYIKLDQVVFVMTAKESFPDLP